MPKVSGYRERTRQIRIEFDGDDEDLNVEYRPRAITPRMEDQFQTYIDENHGERVVFDSLAAMVVTWDLTDDAGVPIPLTPDALNDVPSSVLTYVLNKLREDIRPNPQPSPASVNGSVPAASAEPAPTGSSLSPLPDTSP